MAEIIDKLEETLTKNSDVHSEFSKFMRCALSLFNDGYGCKLTLNPVKITRSVRQNALMWALLQDVSKQVIWHGQKLSKDDWKEIISASWRGQRSVPNIEGSGFVILGARTSKLSIKEMGDLITLIEAFGAQQGVKFSAPEWMYEGVR